MRIPRRLALLAVAVGGLTYLRKVHRFRDPVRPGNAEPGELLCPADGAVSFVRHIDRGQAEELNWPVSELFRRDVAHEGWLVGTLVSPLDVHYTYVPADGTVTSLTHIPGEQQALAGTQLLQIALRQPVDLLDTPATRQNERVVYTQRTSSGPVHVAAVGSRLGRQGLSYLSDGDEVQAGRKALFLPEGGLVITYFPLDARPQVSVGERVVGGQTVMARST